MLHRNNKYDKKIAAVNQHIDQSFEYLNQMLEDLHLYIIEPDPQKELSMEENEDKVNQLELDIEAEVMELLSMQHPTVEDMQNLLCNMKMNRDMERIGDHIISFMHMYKLSSEYPGWMKEELGKIISTELDMLQLIQDGMKHQDQAIIRKAIEMDDKVDENHISLFEKLVHDMKSQDVQVDIGAKLIIMIRFLERLGDHIVNIGETQLDFKMK